MPNKQQETPKEIRSGRVGEKGRVTLPADIRSKYGLKEGDRIFFTETNGGILISPQVLLAQKLLDQMSELFQDTTLEELIESNRAIRHEVAQELNPKTNQTNEAHQPE